MAEVTWIEILIIKDGVRGAVVGIYSHEFLKGNTYRVNSELATMLKAAGSAVDTLGAVPYILHVNENLNTSWMALEAR